jgi:hypothetical protein
VSYLVPIIAEGVAIGLAPYAIVALLLLRRRS